MSDATDAHRSEHTPSPPSGEQSCRPTPWPAPHGEPALLFGGTFDPPHHGHIELAIDARDTLFPRNGWLIFVPAARNPHKPTGPRAGDAHRAAMLRLAAQGHDRVTVWTEELDRAAAAGDDSSPSFWVDTLVTARDLVGQKTPLRFLIGADQALAFNRWHEHKRILSLAEPAVMLRSPCESREAFRRQLIESGLDPAAWMPRIACTRTLDARSTDVREALDHGIEPAHLLGPAVLEYIAEHGLYAR